MRKVRGRPPESIPLAETFDPFDQQKFGWYVFTGQGVREPGAFATRLKAWLDEQGVHQQGFVWLADPNAPDIEGQFIDIRRESRGFFAEPMTFWFRNLGFEIDDSDDDCEIRLEDGKGPGARFAVFGPAGLIAYAARNEPTGKVVSPLRFSLWGDDLGVLRFDLDVDTAALLAYGGDLRYYRSGQAAAFRFPFLDLDALGGSLRLGAHIAPLALEDGARTRYVLPEGPLPSFLETVAGYRLDVLPEADGNFTLAHVLGSGAGPPDFYLCPSGGFALALPGTKGGDRLPCGLFGAEFVRLGADDRLRLVTGQPAFVPEPAAAGRVRREVREEPGEGRITQEATTSWMRFQPGSAELLAYFAQPDLSIYHGRKLPDASRVVGALDVKLSSLDGAAFPAVPYAGAGLVAGGKPINPGLGPADFLAIETDALSPMRQQLIPEYASGPRFEAGDTDAFAVRAAESSFGLTPQGLVARLNADRTWAELLLATSPDPDGKLRTLGFLPDEGDEVLARTLADALMKNDLFLVVSARMPVGEDGASNVGRFQSELTLDGFTFDLALADAAGEEPVAVQSVVVFKFKARALEDLAKDLHEWTEPDRFNQTVSGELPAQKVLLEALDVPADDPRYEHFRRVIRDPNWNGILAVNTAIGGAGLPLAVQGLRGGMRGSLVGHHVGIEVNSVDLASGAFPERCSAFAFLTMKDLAAVRPNLSATQGPFDYRVERFHVSFLDSTIVDFVCDVTLDLDELFDRPLVQDPPGVPANGMLIKGHYELRDGEAAFSFTSDRAHRFLLQPEEDTVRFLKALSVAQARFVTKSAVRDPETKRTEVRAAFELDGGLVFDAGESLPFDVLGYGENNPLSFSSLDLTVSFEMNDAGEVVPGTLDLQFDPASLSLASARESQPSPGSLVSSFPLTLDSFDFNPEGLSPSQLGADWVNSNELLEFWNPTPRFALTFTLPLGSLGALSSVHVSLDARFVVGWGPHPTIPDDDGIGLAVALPQVTPGFRGFNLQGVLKTAFGSCALVKLKDPQQKDMFVLAFNNIALSILGFALPPGYIISFLITANPDRGGGQGAGNLAWLAAVQVDESGKRVLDAPAGGAA